MGQELDSVAEQEARETLLSLINSKHLPSQGVTRAMVLDPVVIINGVNLRISDTARIDSFVKLECGYGTGIGHHVHIASFCHLGIGGGVLLLEDGVACSSGTRIITGSNIHGYGRSCSAVSPSAVFRRSFVHVKRNAILFSGAIVRPGVVIGENAVIGAGAVVTRDVPDFEIWVGNPARKIGVIGPPVES